MPQGRPGDRHCDTGFMFVSLVASPWTTRSWQEATHMLCPPRTQNPCRTAFYTLPPSRTHGRTLTANPTQLHRKRAHPHNERALYVHVHNSDSIKQTHGARTRVYTRSQTIHSMYPIHRDVYARGQQIPNTRTFQG